ncbi:hypothetical protein ACH9D2_18775 [Kocuria sp. M4R2S49]|uniref:hypothetical protein n=1 Tax=Kocuria rhizosphaericola TaxID=3376284 RepID=UPI0037978028
MPIWFESRPEKDVPLAEALPIWAAAAVPILVKYACTPWRYVTYAEFAQDLFKATGLITDRPLQRWPGEVLGMALNYCHEHKLPALSSLVVNGETGTCGVGFGKWHRKLGKEPIGEEAREKLAAELRTQCYQRYAGVPEDAQPFHTPIYLNYRIRGMGA